MTSPIDMRGKTVAGILGVAVLFVFAMPTNSRADVGSPGLLDPSRLELHDGSLTVTEDGAVIENLEIRGTLRINADDVTVRNVWVYTSSFWTIYVEGGSATFEYLEIGHPDHVGQRGIGGSNVVGRYLDIHHVEDGIKLSRNVLYENVRVHDLDSDSSSPHADAVQDDGGSQNAVVRNSSLDSTGPLRNGNAAVIIKSDLGVSRDITFSGNYLNGGNYVVFVNDGGHGMPANVSFVDNRIGPDSTYGLLSTDGTVNWEGNVWEDTGAPANPGDDPTPPTSMAPPATAPSTTAVPTTSLQSGDTASTIADAGAPILADTPDGPSTSADSNTSGTGGESSLSVAPETTKRVDSVPPIAAEDPAPGRGAPVLLIALGVFVLVCYLYVRRRRINEEMESQP